MKHQPADDYTKPANFGRYEDVARILDEALRANGLRITLESPGKAVAWTQAAYTLRKLVRKVNDGRSPWDHMTVSTPRDPVTKKATSPIVTIESRRTGIIAKEYLDPEFANEMGLASPPKQLPMEDFSLD